MEKPIMRLTVMRNLLLQGQKLRWQKVLLSIMPTIEVSLKTV